MVTLSILCAQDSGHTRPPTTWPNTFRIVQARQGVARLPLPSPPPTPPPPLPLPLYNFLKEMILFIHTLLRISFSLPTFQSSMGSIVPYSREVLRTVKEYLVPHVVVPHDSPGTLYNSYISVWAWWLRGVRYIHLYIRIYIHSFSLFLINTPLPPPPPPTHTHPHPHKWFRSSSWYPGATGASVLHIYARKAMSHRACYSVTVESRLDTHLPIGLATPSQWIRTYTQITYL